MLEVIKFLNKKSEELNSSERALEALFDDYGIKNSTNEKYPNLVVLKYDQINSDKTLKIVQECRSLVLERLELNWSVISRYFDRFFNHNEFECVYDFEYISAYEKLDGSIITFFNYKGEWLYRTSSMLMPEGGINGFDRTWKDCIESTMSNIDSLDPSKSYMYELTCLENRVVVRYEGDNIRLLAIRDNETGSYTLQEDVSAFSEGKWGRPTAYKFSSLQECVRASEALSTQNEGFVLYDRHGKPVAKVKGPSYVRAHHMRGDHPRSSKRIIDLILSNELDEYLSVFPDDIEFIKPYEDAYHSILKEIRDKFESIKHKDSVREVVISLGSFKYKSLVINMYKYGINEKEAYGRLLPTSRYGNIKDEVDFNDR